MSDLALSSFDNNKRNQKKVENLIDEAKDYKEPKEISNSTEIVTSTNVAKSLGVARMELIKWIRIRYLF